MLLTLNETYLSASFLRFCYRAEPVVPLTDAHNDSHVTIKWNSRNYLVARYIVDVREYVAGVKGKVEARSVNGYPREISAIQLNHTVESLSM